MTSQITLDAGLTDSSLPFNRLEGCQKLIYGLIGGLLGGLVNESTNHWIDGSLNGLMLSLILGFEKVNEVEVDRKTVPNQSIWKSAANAAKFFVIIGLPTGLLLGVIVSPIYGLVNGLFGLASGLVGGQGTGMTCIKHLTWRCILWWSGYIPWDYAQFLDYASDRIFLQKVGGGYVFIHRLMLEHFAQMELNQLHRQEF